MKVIGIDAQSKKVAYSFLEDYSLQLFGIFNVESLGGIVEDMKGLIEVCKPEVVNIENSIYIQNYRTSKAIAEVIAACRIACEQAGVECKIVSNKTWKKQVVGNGNATKEQIREFAVEVYPQLEGQVQDVCDSACIARWRGQ